MRTQSWTSTAHEVGSASRISNILVMTGILTLVAFFAWRGVSLFVVIPVAVLAIGAALFTAARRALRRASDEIDAIFREELDPERPA